MIFGKQALLERLVRVNSALVAMGMLLTCVAAQTAAASCGDYVTAGQTRHDARRIPEHRTPGGPICRGSNCQKQLPLPVAPEKGLAGRGPTDAAVWSPRYDSADSPAFGAAAEQPLLLTEGHALPLLRPPCL